MKYRKKQRYEGVILRPVGDRWQADLRVQNPATGKWDKRTQRIYETLDEAHRAIDQLVKARGEWERVRSIAELNQKVGLYDLTERQRHDIGEALLILPEGVTVTDTVRFYSQHNPPRDRQRTFEEVYQEYRERKAASGLRPRTLQDIRWKIGPLAETYGGTPIHELFTSDLETWLDRNRLQGSTRANSRRQFIGFFGFAHRRGYIQTNPATAIERVSVDEVIPAVFSVDEVKRLMAHVQAETPDMIPFFAIGLWAGLRPAELEGITWQDFDLQKQRIRVIPAVAKRRRQRYVDVSDNLLEWLLPHRKTRGHLPFSRHGFDKARGIHRRKDKTDPVVRWHNDIMRHTYGSMHLAHHQDAARTALQMGHVTQGILFDHYRDLVTPEDAAEFWQILPSAPGNLLEMPRSHVSA
jgi:integrase